jgi:hypothetical protein
VLLTGHLERLEFSSILDRLSRGYWDIELRVDSSSGHTLTVERRAEFETGYHDLPAREKVAAQYRVAVQAHRVRHEDTFSALPPMAERASNVYESTPGTL